MPNTSTPQPELRPPSSLPASSPALPKLFPPLVSIATHWADPWLIVKASQRGEGHRRKGTANEDVGLIAQVGPYPLLILADGFGSSRASRSAEGAARAALTAAAHAERAFSIYGPTEQLLVEAMAAAHIDLVSTAAAQNQSPDVFATTLQLVLLAKDTLIAARVGNGSLYTWDGKAMTRFCTLPIPAEGTVPITDQCWRSWFASETSARDYIRGLALCTDGADAFFLDTHTKSDRLVPSDIMLRTCADKIASFGLWAPYFTAYDMLIDKDWAQGADDDRSFILVLRPDRLKD